MSGLVVTTSANAGEPERARASVLAERLEAPWVRRTGAIQPLLDEHELVYVVGRNKDELRGSGARVAVHEGMLRSRLHTGVDHPLIRALAPVGRADRVVDGTLGLAGDALHVAGALGCEVVGVEVQAVLFSLVEEGLARLARSERPEVRAAASGVRARLGDSTEVLASMAPGSADAVLLAPMYPSADRAAPGFELLRQTAEHARLKPEQVAAALRVAPRLVVKWPRGLERPSALPPDSDCVSGHRVDYWIARSST